jgi:hypothetical protein
VYPGQAAQELQQGTHLEARTFSGVEEGISNKSKWQKVVKGDDSIYAFSLLLTQPIQDMASVDEAMYRLEMMVLAYLHVFDDGTVPTGTVAIHEKIVSTTLPTGGLSSAYKLFLTLERLLQASTGKEPTYHDMWENVQESIRRSKEFSVHDRESWLVYLDSELKKEERYAHGPDGSAHFSTMKASDKLELMRQVFVQVTKTYGKSMRIIGAGNLQGPIPPPRQPTPPAVIRKARNPTHNSDRMTLGEMCQVLFVDVVTADENNPAGGQMTPEEFTDYVTCERPCDVIAIDMATNMAAGIVTAQFNSVVLSNPEHSALISTESAPAFNLKPCLICGIYGHNGKAIPGTCRFANMEGQLVLDSIVQMVPHRRVTMWKQMQERGILQGFLQLDLDNLWKRILEGATLRDAHHRTEQNDLRRNPQYPTLAPKAGNNSAFAGPGAIHRFGTRADAAGNPLSAADPRNRATVTFPGIAAASTSAPI